MMKERKATDIVEKFESTFYSNISNQTLAELATDYGITLSGRGSVEQLVEEIGNSFLLELFQHEPFQDLPILGTYSIEADVFLLLEAIDTGTCCKCNEEVIVYAGILASYDDGLDFCYYAVPERKITPVRKCRVRDLIKKSEPA